MSKFLLNRLKAALNNGGEKQTTRDFPLIKQNIIGNSQADNYEDARSEWQFANIATDDDIDVFSDRCELCNQGNLRFNFQIFNLHTNKYLMVGSSCIKRFLLLNGTGSIEKSWEYLVDKAYNTAYDRILKNKLPKIFEDEPSQRDVSMFRKTAFKLLGWRSNKDIDRDAVKRFINELVADNDCFEFGRYEKIDRIKNILLNPKKVKTKKVRRDTGQKEGNWASTGRRKTRIVSTLSKSQTYNNYQNRER